MSTNTNTHDSSRSILLRMYFIAVTIITMIMVIVSLSTVIRYGLEHVMLSEAERNTSYPTYCAPEQTKASCDEQRAIDRTNQSAQEKKTIIDSLAMFLVSLPFFLTHGSVVYRDWKKIWHGSEA